MARILGGIFGDALRTFVRNGNLDTLVRRAYIAIGATGAPTITTADGITVTRTGVGTYTGTFPLVAAVSATAIPTIRAWVVLSAVPTVSQCTITAFSPTAGTFGFTVALNAAATGVEAANGDILGIEIVVNDTNG